MSKKINVLPIGIGNCVSAKYQGVHMYKDTDPDNGVIPGIMKNRIGGYHPADIQYVGAIDVDRRKVGRPLGEAIFAAPNCARVFCPNVPDGPIVQMGHVLDGVAPHMLEMPEKEGFRISNAEPIDVVQYMKDNKVDIVENYLPVGSQEAVGYYAQCAIDAGASFINCMPVLTLNHPLWEQKFIDAGLPYIGSDMKSQFGASILSQMLQELAFARGMVIDFHSQVNFGGNTDFGNMVEQTRLKHKKVSKENVIRAQNALNDAPMEDGTLYAGPAAYVPYLKDNKIAHFDLRMRGFGGAEVTLDCKLSVQDSENSAGVVIDAVRYLKVAREMGIIGCLRGASAMFMKSPPKQMSFSDAKYECEMLADRKLTAITSRQLTREDAMAFAKEEHESVRNQPAMKPYIDLMDEYAFRKK